MKTWKKITASLIAISMAFSLSSCKKDSEKESLTLQELLEVSADETTLDEIIELKAIELSENNKPIEKNFADSVYKLESYIGILDKIESTSFSSNKSPVEDLNRDYNELWVYETEYLLDLYTSDDLSSSEKEKVEEELKHQELGYKRWVVKNGLTISHELLSYIIKGSVCSEVKLPSQQYDCCVIGPVNDNDETESIGTIEIVSPSDYRIVDTYTVYEDDNTISNALNSLYNIKDILDDENAYYRIKIICKEALEYTKLLAISDIKIDDNEIKSTSNDKAQKILSKKTKKIIRKQQKESD